MAYPIEDILSEDILAHPENPFLHPDKQKLAIAASYAELGDLAPLVWNKRTRRLVDGHARFEVLRHTQTSFRCVVVDWDEEKERKALLTINRTGAMASLDDLAFLSLLEQFDVDSDPLLSTMYDEDLVKELLEREETPAPALAGSVATGARARDDEGGGGDAFLEGMAELPPTRTQAGEVWQLGRHKLAVGDCTLPSVMHRLDIGRISLVLTDPPYDIEAGSGEGGSLGQRNIWKQLRNASLDGFDPTPFLETVELYLAKACNFEVFCDQSLLAYYLDWAQARGFTTDVLVWQKPNPTPLSDQRWPEIEYLVQMRRQGAFNADAPHRRKKVLSYARHLGVHPTIKPLALVLGEMELLSKEGDIVFDGFIGTGTTLIAGERLGRTVFACEKSPRWADMALARWEAETGEKAWPDEK